VTIRNISFFLAAITLAHTQSLPKFEAASVKPAGPYNPAAITGPWFSGGPGSNDPGRITWSRVELMFALTRAYKVSTDCVSGPPWLNTEFYSIVATMPPNTSEARFDLMLQDLLATRFHLKLHHATKDFPGYELVVAPGGPKLKPWHPDAAFLAVAPQDAGGPGPLDKDGFAALRPGQRVMNPVVNGVMHSTRRQSMSALAQDLGWLLNLSTGDGGPRPRVADKTGLAGEYEFKLEFAVASVQSHDAASEPSGGPTLFAALQKQLGLKLVKVKSVTEDILVIDHIDKVPSEN
jgi:uncharacterized protein (TIGR03435 family)